MTLMYLQHLGDWLPFSEANEEVSGFLTKAFIPNTENYDINAYYIVRHS